ncbi:MAG: hypothetical protein ACREFJ_04040 [Acetobacteraceae bacterium]
MTGRRDGDPVRVRRLGALIALLLLLGVAAGSRVALASGAAASPAAACRRLGTDDQLRPIPGSLVPAATRLFGLEAMPANQVERSTVFRCFEGKVLVCNYGANLPCGKADTRRTLAGASGWCATHPDAAFIPMYVTGHDTIYRWRCHGGQAVTTATIFSVDPRGFIRQFWKPAVP